MWFPEMTRSGKRSIHPPRLGKPNSTVSSWCHEPWGREDNSRFSPARVFLVSPRVGPTMSLKTQQGRADRFVTRNWSNHPERAEWNRGVHLRDRVFSKEGT